MRLARGLGWLGLAILAASASIAASTPVAGRPTPAPDPLAGALDAVEADGWTRVGAVRAFDADNLWEFIDGDAERFVDAGLERMRTAEFRYRGRLDAVVEIYRMKDADGARRIFQSESASGTRQVDIGGEGRLHDTGLTFRVGRHFARVSAFEATPETKDAVLVLARALAGRLGEK
jgi:hypothetical protein